jgi:hypothetical protein
MIVGLNPRKLVYRDGTSQSQRIIGAPDPGSINIEERSLRDFLEFATRFAKYINFYDEENKVSGDWSGFLNGGLLHSADQQKWLDGLVNYASGPDKFSLAPQGTPLSSPHLALFVTFLKLLDNIKLQVNDFTKMHLDLYYDELLGIDKKQQVPDVVNIIVQLTADVERLLVPKGTQLKAGKDSEGKDLIYETEKDTLISQAAVQNIKSLFVDKNVLGLHQKRLKFFDRIEGFKEIMNMALGYDTFDPLLSEEDIPAVALKYLLSDTELTFIVHAVHLTEETTRWERIYHTLERGYRRLLIKSKQQSTSVPPSLFSLLQIAIGNNDGRLPDLSNTKVDAATLDRLYDQAVKKADSPEKAQAIAYIMDKLMLSVSEFSTLAKSLKDKEITEVRWREIYILLETARSKRKDLVLAAPQETEWKNIVAVDDVKAIADGAPQVEQFKTFGMAGGQTGKPVSLGMAISSPRLIMREGKRDIDVYIAFNPIETRKNDQLADAINKRSKLPPPFLFYISTSKGWKKITEKAMSFGDFLRPVPGRTVPEFAIKDDVLSSATKMFTPADEGQYIVLADGSVYEVDNVIDTNSARLLLKAKLTGQPVAKRYTRTELLLNALHVRFELTETDPEILAPAPADETIKLQHTDPVLAFMLNDSEQQTTLVNGFNTWYQKFHELTIAGIHVDVDVKDI